MCQRRIVISTKPLLMPQKYLILSADKASGGSCQNSATLPSSSTWNTSSMMARWPECWIAQNSLRLPQSPMVLKRPVCSLIVCTLFSMKFTVMLNGIIQANDAGINLKYRADGKLFNLGRLQAITKVKETVLRFPFYQ